MTCFHHARSGRNRGRFLVIRMAACGLALAPFCLAPSTFAADLVNNGSFENLNNTWVDNTGNNGGQSVAQGSTTIPGWTTTQELAWINTPNNYAGSYATAGNFHLDLTGYRDAAPLAGVTQTLATVAGTRYTLSFDLGVNTAYGSSVGIVANVGGVSSVFHFDAPQGGQSWSKRVLTFTATSATTALTLTGSTGSQYVGLDNVSVNELVGTQILSQSIGLTVGAGNKQKVGTFAGGEQIRLQFGGNGDLVDARYQVRADGSLFSPATGAYAFANEGAAYPSFDGGDGINHFVGGGANYDATGSGYGFAGKKTTNTFDLAAIRSGAVVGTFNPNPIANSADWFVIGADGTFTVPTGGGDLYLAINDTNNGDNHGLFTGTMSVTAPAVVTVPEAGTGVLMSGMSLLGLIGTVVARRRDRTKSL